MNPEDKTNDPTDTALGVFGKDGDKVTSDKTDVSEENDSILAVKPNTNGSVDVTVDKSDSNQSLTDEELEAFGVDTSDSTAVNELKDFFENSKDFTDEEALRIANRSFGEKLSADQIKDIYYESIGFNLTEKSSNKDDVYEIGKDTTPMTIK